MLLSRRLLSTAVLSSSLLPAASSMRVLLIRHAQSQNNVIAREERSVPGRSRKEARAAFEKRRYEDPMLSELGSAQAESLGTYPLPDSAPAPLSHASGCSAGAIVSGQSVLPLALSAPPVWPNPNGLGEPRSLA